MEGTTSDILDDDFDNQPAKRRRSLLPWWIKAFCWIFITMGLFVFIGLILGPTGMKFQVSMYGFETNNPLSITGLGLMLVFLLNGITALGLWAEKDWAITVAMADAFVGIAICAFAMFIYPLIDADPGIDPPMRYELLLLIPFLMKLYKIKPEWTKSKKQ